MPGLGHDQRLLVDPAGDQHQPLGGPGDDPVVRGERRGGARSACTTAATSSAGAEVGRASARPRPAAARPPRRRAAGRAGRRATDPAAASAWIRASACGRRRPSAGASASSSVETRSAAWRDLVPVAVAQLGQRRGRPSSTALAWAPRSSDSAVVSGDVRRRPAVAQHHVDAVAGGGERGRARPRGTGQPGQRIDGSVRSQPVRLCQDRRRSAGSLQLMDDELHRQARSFGSVAEVYDRGRPSFPREAAEWLVGEQPGHRARAGRRHRQAHRAAGRARPRRPRDRPRRGDARRPAHAGSPTPAPRVAGAEDLSRSPTGRSTWWSRPSAFHWFDHDRALPEIARVLKPGGQLALVWNVRDERIPWVRKLGRIIGSQDQQSTTTSPSRWCCPACSASSRTRRSSTGRRSTASRSWTSSLSRSNIADPRRRRPGGQARRGARVLRRLRPRAWTACSCPTTPAASRPSSATGRTPDGDDERRAEPVGADQPPTDGTDTDMLLIDFR